MYDATFYLTNFGLLRLNLSKNFFAACFVAIGFLVSGCGTLKISEWTQLNSNLVVLPDTSSPTTQPKTSSTLSTQSQKQKPTFAAKTEPQPSLPPPRPVIVSRPPPQLVKEEKNKLLSFVPVLTRSSGTIDEDQPLQNKAPPPPLPTKGTVRAALLLPLSGPNAAVGHAMLNAAQLAVFSFAAIGFELLPKDTKGTPEGAVQAAALAIGDGAEIILGPLLSASVKAISFHARAAGVPVIGFSSDRTVAGGGTYTMGFLPSAEVYRIVAFAYANGHKRFAALVPDNSYGATIVSALKSVANNLGAKVTQVKYYDPFTEDYTAIVRELASYKKRRSALLFQRKELRGRDDEIAQKALRRLERLQTIGDLPFDALLLPVGGKNLQAIAALLPFFDIDPAKIKMLGTGQWDATGLGAEPALIGAWFAAPPPVARIDFIRQYKELYGKLPHRLATLAYDAGALAAVLSRGKDGANFSEEAIKTPSGFAGRDGIFRFLPEGVAERGLAVLQLTPRGPKVIDAAPAAFVIRPLN